MSLSRLVRVWDGERVKGVDAQTLFQLKGGFVTSVCERLVFFLFLFFKKKIQKSWTSGISTALKKKLINFLLTLDYFFHL
jgi:hypothetical protein